jgi:tetratricopeptide (TPR) repeat protein
MKMPLIKSEFFGRIIAPDTRKEIMKTVAGKIASSENFTDHELMELWAILAECYKFEQMPLESEQAYYKVIEIASSNKDDFITAEAFDAIGDTWNFVKNNKKSIEYYYKAADIFQNSDLNRWMVSLSQIAYAYKELNERVEEQKILHILINANGLPPIQKGLFLERLALSLELSDLKQAIQSYEEALDIYKSEHFVRDLEKRVKYLAKLYKTANDIEGEQRTLNRLYKC